MPTFGDPRLPARFWAKVRVDEGTDCWVWTAAQDRRGYGVFAISARPTVARRAHRVAYEALVAPVPAGMEPDHLCRWPACVNPDHLEPVTHRENCTRGDQRCNNGNALKTHCKRGHRFTPDNTYRSPDGRRRSCRTCERAKNERQRRARGQHPRVFRRREGMPA